MAGAGPVARRVSQRGAPLSEERSDLPRGPVGRHYGIVPPASAKPSVILLVDDNETIREMGAEALRRDGHTVQLAASGREALRQLRRQGFDLVILDIIMPEGDGIEVLGELRRHFSQIPVIAMSGGGQYLSSETCTDSAEKLGARVSLKKPFDVAELRAAVETALR